MKHCGRDADRKARAAASAYRALANDCKNELSPAFLERIRTTLSDPQRNLFAGGLAAACAAGSVKRGGQVMEQAVLGHLRRREACGQNGKASVLGAIADAVSSRRDAQFRAMEGHWLKKGGISATPAVQAAKQALQTLSVIDMASQILENQIDSREAKGAKRNVDLDEDLRAEGGAA